MRGDREILMLENAMFGQVAMIPQAGLNGFGSFHSALAICYTFKRSQLSYPMGLGISIRAMRRQLNKHLFSAFQPYWMYFNVIPRCEHQELWEATFMSDSMMECRMSMHVVICKYLWCVCVHVFERICIIANTMIRLARI